MRQALVLENRNPGAEAVVHQSQPAGAVVHQSQPVGAGVHRSPQHEVMHQSLRCSRIRVPARFQRPRPHPLHQRTQVEEEEAEVEACRRAQEEVYRT